MLIINSRCLSAIDKDHVHIELVFLHKLSDFNLPYSHPSPLVLPERFLGIGNSALSGFGGAVSSIGRLLAGEINQCRYGKVEDCKNGGYPSPKNAFAVVGLGAVICGLVVILKVINKVYLCAWFNEYMAVIGFFLGAALVWFGGFLILYVMGFL